MLIFVLSPASGISSVLPESSLPESHLDNSVPLCSEGYDEENLHQPDDECSTSFSGCGSFEDNEVVFTGSYAEAVSHSSSNLRRNPEETENVGMKTMMLWRTKSKMLLFVLYLNHLIFCMRQRDL